VPLREIEHVSVPAALKELVWQEILLNCGCDGDGDDDVEAAGLNWIP
jgi:hypothetical protein